MPMKRALALLLGGLETSLDLMESLPDADFPLRAALARRRRAVILLRGRLSRNDRPRVLHRSGQSVRLSDLLQKETELLAQFESAIALPGLDAEFVRLLRSLRAETEELRLVLARSIEGRVDPGPSQVRRSS